ncbi:MAG TPA: hypothetical protein VMY76_14040 [Gemmatimonadales bacterium]|nr:hypothetical protein [Gemmatimonadales bacterium]
MRDFRLWWGLFVAFAVLSVLVVQRGYRRWLVARDVLDGADPVRRAEFARRLRREAWRLAWMIVSLVTMTALAFAAVVGAPPSIILGLRIAAVASVAAVLVLSLLR